MPDRVEIQLARPVADVRILPGGPAGAPRPAGRDLLAGQTEQDVQQKLEAELAALRSALTAVEEAARKLRELQQCLLEEAEGQLVELSMEIARKVLMQEIKAGRHEVDPIVREALSEIPSGMEVAVHLHPDDLSRCALAQQDGQADGKEARFVADRGVKRAECLLETAQGKVESTVEGRLTEIAEALNDQE